MICRILIRYLIQEANQFFVCTPTPLHISTPSSSSSFHSYINTPGVFVISLSIPQVFSNYPLTLSTPQSLISFQLSLFTQTCHSFTTLNHPPTQIFSSFNLSGYHKIRKANEDDLLFFTSLIRYLINSILSLKFFHSFNDSLKPMISKNITLLLN